MWEEIIGRTLKNVVTLGAMVLISAVVGQTVRDQTNETVSCLTQDIRKVRNDFQKAKAA